MILKSNPLRTVARRIAQKITNSSDVILIGHTYLIENKEVKIIKKIKSDLKLDRHHKTNNYKAFIGETMEGTRMFVHPTDVLCPVRSVKRIA